ncbi:MAG: ribonuclease R [Bacteroidales bacterium]
MAKQEKKNKVARLKKSQIANMVVEMFKSAPTNVLNYKQICHGLSLKTTPQKQLVVNILDQLTIEDFLEEVDLGRFRMKMRGNMVTGIFERRSNGKNMLVPEDGGESVFIPERRSKNALNGDKVQAVVYAKRKGKDTEAEVVEILERAPQRFIGVLDVSQNYAFVITDSKLLANDIFIPKNKLNGGKHGQKVVTRIIEWPENRKNPTGEIIDVLGDVGENNTEIHAILAEFGLPYDYPEEVAKLADKIPDEIPAEEYQKREDFRGVTTFTIDPKDAKDFDDALSIRKLGNGNWEIGVHIADVTHYVQPDSIIDKEAVNRATSIYLVDRVIPMLPERLSNGVCSLRPNEEKLCFSCVFEMNEEAEVKDYRIVRTVIYSDRRFTYEEAQEIIETGEGDYKEEILTMNALAQKLRQNRFSNGAINFDRHEVRFDIDEKGKPVSVYFKVAKEANKLVEEFMLLANRTVAEFVGKPKNKSSKPKTFVYRIHDLPDPEKMENFAAMVRRFGYKLRTEGATVDVSKSINKLLDQVQGHKEEDLIETVAIRAMAKAIYSTKNIGHYGLAFEYYTHFTSPIRRYPDMMVHRLLEKYLDGGRSVTEQKYEKLCKHSTDMELLAASAERASIKYKQVEYMSERLGMVYDGVISGVTEWGLYVEINENKCEGMIPIRDLDDDYYELDDKNYRIVGRRNKKMYSLGDPIKIKVARANIERKQLDFALVKE